MEVWDTVELWDIRGDEEGVIAPPAVSDPTKQISAKKSPQIHVLFFTACLMEWNGE